MMNVVANQVIIDAGIFWTLKAIMTTILSSISESRNDHFEAIFFSAPGISDVFQSHIIGLREDDTALTDVVVGFVATDTFLQKISEKNLK